MSGRTIGVIATALVLAVGGYTLWPQRPGPPAPPAAQEGDFYGIAGGVQGGDGNGAALVRELGVGWLRVTLNWGAVEPVRDEVDWQPYENALQMHQAHMPDVELLVMLRAKSPWAGGYQTEKATAPPVEMRGYAGFVRGAVERGRGIVAAYQIENEMESPDWWDGTAGQYVALLRVAHHQIRRADPSAYIVMGGFTSGDSLVAAMVADGAPWESIARELGLDEPPSDAAIGRFRKRLEFIDEVLERGPRYVHAVDLHCYHRPATIPTKAGWLGDELTKRGYQRGIWITEGGGPDMTVEEYTEEAQAEDVAERLAGARRAGVDHFFWLTLHETENPKPRWQCLGLVTQEGRRKPGFAAYREVIGG